MDFYEVFKQDFYLGIQEGIILCLLIAGGEMILVWQKLKYEMEIVRIAFYWNSLHRKSIESSLVFLRVKSFTSVTTRNDWLQTVCFSSNFLIFSLEIFTFEMSLKQIYQKKQMKPRNNLLYLSKNGLPIAFY